MQAALHRRDLPNLRAVSTRGNLGLAAAANLGVRAARGDHLLFTDDDCIAREDWVERTVDALRTSPIVAGAIASPRANTIRMGYMNGPPCWKKLIKVLT